MKVTTETKALIAAMSGRVVGIVKSDEPRRISLAVPGDRAVLSPAQARELATWLIEQAADAEPPTRSERARTTWHAEEARLRDEMSRRFDSRGPLRVWEDEAPRG